MALLDGLEASKKAKEYFTQIHGSFFVWAFEVDSASYDSSMKQWTVRRRFAPGYGSDVRYRFEVAIDEDGLVKGVKRLGDEVNQPTGSL